MGDNARRMRYDDCDETCTVDCGHCKGNGPPTPVSSGEAGTGEAWDPNCVGLCGHGKDLSACPSGCTEDAPVSSSLAGSLDGYRIEHRPSPFGGTEAVAFYNRDAHPAPVVAPSAEGAAQIGSSTDAAGNQSSITFGQ